MKNEDVPPMDDPKAMSSLTARYRVGAWGALVPMTMQNCKKSIWHLVAPNLFVTTSTSHLLSWWDHGRCHRMA